jgi:hypothetical protein
MPKPKKHVLVCVQGAPRSPARFLPGKGLRPDLAGLFGRFTARNLWSSGFQLTNTGCLGPCHLAPAW